MYTHTHTHVHTHTHTHTLSLSHTHTHIQVVARVLDIGMLLVVRVCLLDLLRLHQVADGARSGGSCLCWLHGSGVAFVFPDHWRARLLGVLFVCAPNLFRHQDWLNVAARSFWLFTLRCTATHCIALQRTATHCNTRQRDATQCADFEFYPTIDWFIKYLGSFSLSVYTAMHGDLLQPQIVSKI